MRFARTLLLGAGAAFLLSGIVFFFAFNWASWHRFVKLGTAAGLLTVTGLSGLFLPLRGHLRPVILIAAVALIGVLLAVLGQAYQTGADSFDLFLTWSLFALPWVALVHFAPLWLLYAVVLNLTLVTYTRQVSEELGFVAIGLLLFVLNTLLWLVVWLWGRRRPAFGWLLKLLALWAATNVSVAISSGSFDEDPVWLGLTVGLGLTVYAGWAVLSVRQRTVYYLAVTGGSVLLTVTFLLLRLADNSLAYLLAGTLVLTGVTVLANRLNRLSEGWRTTPQEGVPDSDTNSDDANTGVAVKVLSGIGGFFASLLFLLFLWIADLINRPVVASALGAVLVVATILLGRNPRQAFLATITVCGYLVGVGLTMVGLPPEVTDQQLVIPVVVIAVATLVFTRNYFLVFLAVVSLPACLLYLYLVNPTFIYVDLAVVFTALALVSFNLLEPRVSTHPSFPAVRTGLACGLLMVLLFYRWGNWMADLPQTYYAEAPAAISLYLLSVIVLWRSIPRAWAIGAGLVILPLTLLPLLLGSLLLLLASFRNRHFVGIGLGASGLLYFTAQYYYDLRWTLLDKSFVLMGSGLALLALYTLLQRKFTRSESN